MGRMETTAMTRVEGKCIKAKTKAFLIRFRVVFAKVCNYRKNIQRQDNEKSGDSQGNIEKRFPHRGGAVL